MRLIIFMFYFILFGQILLLIQTWYINIFTTSIKYPDIPTILALTPLG